LSNEDETDMRETVASAAGISVQRINYALTVARYAEHLVQDVIDGVPGKTRSISSRCRSGR
jgi:hypothetical protein